MLLWLAGLIKLQKLRKDGAKSGFNVQKSLWTIYNIASAQAV
jgi:hypothetical protein